MKKKTYFSPEDIIKKQFKNYNSHGILGISNDKEYQVFYGIKNTTVDIVLINFISHKRLTSNMGKTFETKEDAVAYIHQIKIEMEKLLLNSWLSWI